MNKKEIISEIKLSYLIILLLGGLGMIMIAFFAISNSLSDDYIQIIGFVLGILFGFAGFGCLVWIFLLEKIILKNDKLIIQTITGRIKKSINLFEIKSYMEIEKEQKNFKWKDLTIFTKNSKHTISSYHNSNYKVFKKKLTKGKKKNLGAEKLWHYKINQRYGIGFSIVGLLLLLFFGNMYINRNSEVQMTELSLINGTVATKIEVKKKTGRKTKSFSFHFTPIELKEYPKFKFSLGAAGLNATDFNQLISNVKIGDQIQLNILTDQLKKKLTKEIPMNLWDKGINYRTIGIYGIRDKEKDYFDLDKFNREQSKDRNSWGMYFLLGLSLLISIYGIHRLIKNQHEKTRF